jgi:hypothetical protein
VDAVAVGGASPEYRPGIPEIIRGRGGGGRMSGLSSLSPSLSGDDEVEEEEEEDEGVDGYRKGGYHAVRPGDRFAAGRYVAQRKLGWGNFSTVWLAFDVQCEVRLRTP